METKIETKKIIRIELNEKEKEDLLKVLQTLERLEEIMKENKCNTINYIEEDYEECKEMTLSTDNITLHNAIELISNVYDIYNIE